MNPTSTPEARARQGALRANLWNAAYGVLIPIVLVGLGGAFTSLGLPMLAAYVLALIIILFSFAAFVRLSFLTRQPESLPIKSYQALREPLPGLNPAAFNDFRRELMLLDFEPLGGCRVLDENGALSHRVYDVWAHPQHLCYAVIDQRLPFVSGPSGGVRLAFWTGYGDRWWYGTFSTTPSRIAFLLRAPRTLWTAAPDSGVETLLTRHLELREDVAKGTGRTPDLPLSLDSFINGQAVQYAASREVLRRKNVLRGFSEFLMFNSTPHHEWMGELSS